MLIYPRKFLSLITIFLENLFYLKKLLHQMNGPVERGIGAA